MKHLPTLAFDLVFQQLRIEERPNRHWGCPRKKAYTMIMASLWW
jgi:hypothetical protein